MRRRGERLIEWSLGAVAFGCLLALGGMLFFLFKEGAGLMEVVGLDDFLLCTSWFPTSEPPSFGILPLIWGSLMVTAGALAFSIPLGLALAIYIAEAASPRVRGILKPALEVLAGIPSVVFGFFGMAILGPLLQEIFDIPTGLCALNASILLGLMALPTIVSMSEDALSAVPKTFKEASLALGATRWQTIRHVLLPTASSGIICSFILGIGRAIGETMTVLMVAGNAPIFATSYLEPVRTLTATIALEMGEAVKGSPHYRALFAIGGVLFLITLFFNIVAERLREGFKGRFG